MQGGVGAGEWATGIETIRLSVYIMEPKGNGYF
jgi:hypothetical protein